MPHVEDLLKRPTIAKPAEQFLLPASPSLPAGPPSPRPALAASSQSGPQALQAEAGAVQELIDLIRATAPEVEVSVPGTESALIGATLRTRQYLDSFSAGATGPVERLQRAFEDGVLQGAVEAWPVLVVGDLLWLRDTLSTTAQVMDGTVLATTPLTSGITDWSRVSQGSHLGSLQQSLLDASRQIRGKLLHAGLTLHARLPDGFYETLLTPLFNQAESLLLPELRKVRDLLLTFRRLLTIRTHFSGSEFAGLRDAARTAAETLLVRTLLQTLTVLLSRVSDRLVHPVIAFLESEVGGLPVAQALDPGMRQVATVLTDSCHRVTWHYTSLAADLIRSEDQKLRLSLQKIHTLGEASTTSRWTQELDRVIQMINQELAQPQFARTQAIALGKKLSGAAGPSLSPMAQSLKQAAEAQGYHNLPWQFVAESAFGTLAR